METTRQKLIKSVEELGRYEAEVRWQRTQQREMLIQATILYLKVASDTQLT